MKRQVVLRIRWCQMAGASTKYRFATAEDALLLAPLNKELIRDEGHRNPMDIDQLAERMADWLRGEYRAVIFEEDSSPVGYALFRREPEYVYLRQLFVLPTYRRKGIARNAMNWLWRNAWLDAPRLQIEVLLENETACAFWRAVGFQEYSLTMEALPADRGC